MNFVFHFYTLELTSWIWTNPLNWRAEIWEPFKMKLIWGLQSWTLCGWAISFGSRPLVPKELPEHCWASIFHALSIMAVLNHWLPNPSITCRSMLSSSGWWFDSLYPKAWRHFCLYWTWAVCMYVNRGKLVFKGGPWTLDDQCTDWQKLDSSMAHISLGDMSPSSPHSLRGCPCGSIRSSLLGHHRSVADGYETCLPALITHQLPLHAKFSGREWDCWTT